MTQERTRGDTMRRSDLIGGMLGLTTMSSAALLLGGTRWVVILATSLWVFWLLHRREPFGRAFCLGCAAALATASLVWFADPSGDISPGALLLGFSTFAGILFLAVGTLAITPPPITWEELRGWFDQTVVLGLCTGVVALSFAPFPAAADAASRAGFAAAVFGAAVFASARAGLACGAWLRRKAGYHTESVPRLFGSDTAAPHV